MKEKIFLVLFIALIITAGALYFLPDSMQRQNPAPEPAPEPPPPPPAVSFENPYPDQISIDSPQPGASITSPVSISGKARGTWYFEASFPIQITDAQGTVLAQVPMQATGDWMTTEFVPFTGSVEFATPTTTTGFIIFKNDNPSGLPENEKSVSLPVRFQ